MKRRNFHYFEIKGLNQERFFNALSKKLEIFEIKRYEKNRSSFKVKYFDGKAAKKEILDAGYEILSEKRGGFFWQINRFCTAYGLLAGIIVTSILLAAQSPFIAKVEVWGSTNSTEICEFVKKNLPTKNKNRLDTDVIEHLINSQFENVSFVSAAIVGQSLVINVKNALVPPEMEGKFAPIVSEYDGVVTAVNLVQGTLKVQVGDIIQRGQILVEGRVINSEGESFDIQPIAEIYMDVWLEGEATHFDEQIVTSRTGRKIETSVVTLFGKEFYSSVRPNTFASFETETSSQPLIKNNILPFMLTKTIYYETKTQTINSSFEQKKEETIAAARANCLQNLGECEIIKEENFRIIEGAGCTTVKYVVTANLLVTGEK